MKLHSVNIGNYLNVISLYVNLYLYCIFKSTVSDLSPLLLLLYIPLTVKDLYKYVLSVRSLSQKTRLKNMTMKYTKKLNARIAIRKWK